MAKIYQKEQRINGTVVITYSDSPSPGAEEATLKLLTQPSKATIAKPSKETVTQAPVKTPVATQPEITAATGYTEFKLEDIPKTFPQVDFTGITLKGTVNPKLKSDNYVRVLLDSKALFNGQKVTPIYFDTSEKAKKLVDASPLVVIVTPTSDATKSDLTVKLSNLTPYTMPPGQHTLQLEIIDGTNQILKKSNTLTFATLLSHVYLHLPIQQQVHPLFFKFVKVIADTARTIVKPIS